MDIFDKGHDIAAKLKETGISHMTIKNWHNDPDVMTDGIKIYKQLWPRTKPEKRGRKKTDNVL